MSIAVVTAITGGVDKLIEHKNENPEVSFIAFTDKTFKSNSWTQVPACNNFKSNRRNSRIHKILIHQFVSSKYSIWLDGNIRLNVPAEQVVEDWLKDHDIALFKHPERNCIYDAINVCIGINKGNEIALLKEQGRLYQLGGYPKQKGLCEAGVIVRRHCETIEAFNNFWWSEHCRFSSRDQISLMYVLNKLNLKVNVVHGALPRTFENRWGHSYFSYSNHL